MGQQEPNPKCSIIFLVHSILKWQKTASYQDFLEVVSPNIKCLGHLLRLINEANLIFSMHCWTPVRKGLDLGGSRGCFCELSGVPHPVPQFLECAVVKCIVKCNAMTVWKKHKFSSHAIQQTPERCPSPLRGFPSLAKVPQSLQTLPTGILCTSYQKNKTALFPLAQVSMTSQEQTGHWNGNCFPEACHARSLTDTALRYACIICEV